MLTQVLKHNCILSGSNIYSLILKMVNFLSHKHFCHLHLHGLETPLDILTHPGL
uniref:Uncharacterized protein n=1 Tax=Anguilla anguilla TaxID=7936 RepID=A0A0E9WSD8_ANGAN